jgi:subtilisin family serine protease
VVVETDGQNDPPITTFATPNAANSATLQGHPGAAGALAVGAAFYFDTPACGTTPAAIEAFSAEGGAPILFDSAGVRLAAPTTRQKPDVVGPDGGNDTFLGFTLASDGIPGGQLDTPIAACQNDASYPNFFGTSAATPHVAGIATLILQANAAATPTQIASALRSSALAMGGAAGFNYTSGFGFVQADAALALIPPAAPRISAAAASITAGGSTTLTWSSVNASGCTASGSWSGAEAASGTQTISPAASGVATYTLTCTNAAGTSPASSVSVTVNPAPSGGGGSLDWVTVLGLAVLFSRRLRRPL